MTEQNNLQNNLQTMDAQVWAHEFMRLFQDRKEDIDHGLMLAWFANAIMEGFDEANRRNAPTPATIAQQAQELERVTVELLAARSACEAWGNQVTKDREQLAAMTQERDEAVQIGRENAEKFATAEAHFQTALADLQATIAAREATIDGLRAECRRIECLHHAVSQDAARLRAALKAHMQLAAKICYAEPELSQHRALTAQAQAALKEA